MENVESVQHPRCRRGTLVTKRERSSSSTELLKSSVPAFAADSQRCQPNRRSNWMRCPGRRCGQDVGRNKPLMSFNSVVLPLPLRPITARSNLGRVERQSVEHVTSE